MEEKLNNSLDFSQVRETTRVPADSLNAYLKLGWKIIAPLKGEDSGQEYLHYELAWLSDEPPRTPYR